MTTGTQNQPTVKIALTGGIRSGKDTVAEYLSKAIDTHCINNKLRTLAFSDGITDLIENYLPSLFNEGKPRKAYQTIGQTLRQFDEDVWIKYALETIEINEQIYPNSNYIITDLRQPNEARVLRELGFTIVKVTSDYSTRLERARKINDQFTEEDMYHETELSIDLIEPDFILENNGTLDDLYEDVENMLISEILYNGGDNDE